jgi:hypothetical protein
LDLQFAAATLGRRDPVAGTATNWRKRGRQVVRPLRIVDDPAVHSQSWLREGSSGARLSLGPRQPFGVLRVSVAAVSDGVGLYMLRTTFWAD